MKTTVKVFSAALAVLLVVTLTLGAMRILSFSVFWIVAVFSAIWAYLILPKLK